MFEILCFTLIISIVLFKSMVDVFFLSHFRRVTSAVTFLCVCCILPSDTLEQGTCQTEKNSRNNSEIEPSVSKKREAGGVKWGNVDVFLRIGYR